MIKEGSYKGATLSDNWAAYLETVNQVHNLGVPICNRFRCRSFDGQEQEITWTTETKNKYTLKLRGV